jgi:hypothetical protein
MFTLQPLFRDNRDGKAVNRNKPEDLPDALDESQRFRVKGRRSKYGFPVYIPLAPLLIFDDFSPSSFKESISGII